MYTWIHENSSIILQSNNTSNATITVTVMTEHHLGTIFCIATNAAGRMGNTSIMIELGCKNNYIIPVFQTYSLYSPLLEVHLWCWYWISIRHRYSQGLCMCLKVQPFCQNTYKDIHGQLWLFFFSYTSFQYECTLLPWIF